MDRPARDKSRRRSDRTKKDRGNTRTGTVLQDASPWLLSKFSARSRLSAEASQIHDETVSQLLYASLYGTLGSFSTVFSQASVPESLERAALFRSAGSALGGLEEACRKARLKAESIAKGLLREGAKESQVSFVTPVKPTTPPEVTGGDVA